MTDLKKPHRVVRRRIRGFRMPPNTVYVGRGSRWGNPCKVGDVMMSSDSEKPIDRVATHQDCVNYYKKNMIPLFKNWPEKFLHPLKGKNLACWCKEGQACHADALLEVVNQNGESDHDKSE